MATWECFFGHRSLDDLVKKQLIGLIEVRSESLVHNVDELRGRHRLRPDEAAALSA